MLIDAPPSVITCILAPAIPVPAILEPAIPAPAIHQRCTAYEYSISDAGDGRLSDAELMSTAMGLLIAGHETTANMITKMVLMLLADRSRWEALVANRGLIRTAVEEALRMDANAGFGMPRFITEDIELSGVAVRAGSTVVSSLAAANRDPEVFVASEQMDLARTANASASSRRRPASTTFQLPPAAPARSPARCRCRPR